MERLLNALTGRKKSKKRSEKNSRVHDKSTLAPILKENEKTESVQKPPPIKILPSKCEKKEEPEPVVNTHGNKETIEEFLRSDQLNRPSISRQVSTESRRSQVSQHEAFKTSLLRQTLPARIKQLSIEEDIYPNSKETVLSKDLSRIGKVEPLVQNHFKEVDDIIQFADEVEETVTDNEIREDFDRNFSGTDSSQKQYDKAVRVLGPQEPTVIESNRSSRLLRRQVSATGKYCEVDARPKEVKLSSEGNFRGTFTSGRGQTRLTKQDSVSQRNNLGASKFGNQGSINRRNGQLANQSSINSRRNGQLSTQGSVGRRNSILTKQESISIGIKHYPDVVTNKVGYTGSILSSRKDQSKNSSNMRSQQQSSMENTAVGKRAARFKKQQTLPAS